MIGRSFPRNVSPGNSRPIRRALCAGPWALVCWVSAFCGVAPSASADPPQSLLGRFNPLRSATPSPVQPKADATPQTKIVAIVNGHEITRQELGDECSQHYGKEVLENVINQRLISQECKRLGVQVTDAEVDEEIQRLAKRFGLPVDQWLKMLKQERGIKPAQYASDIIWPTLALRKLAHERLQVSHEELFNAYEAMYGPAVRARIIVCDNPQEAQSLRAEVAVHPDNFGNLAKDRSKDSDSASAKGMIQPIRRHMGDPQIEQAAFTLKDGEISQVIPVAHQFVILKREAEEPPQPVPFDAAKPRLEEMLRDRKLRNVANEIFRDLQKRSQVQNLLKDPAAAQQMPGVAAVINGQPLTLRELADECIERHGEEVLEGTINRRLISEACKRANIVITEKDLDDEIARAAATNLKAKPDGSPDVEGWLKAVTQQQAITVELYRRDVVWPSVALKRLVGDKVLITEEDLRKSFEANYGPRVRCRAIVLNNVRIAQKVWDRARTAPPEELKHDERAQREWTVEHFGKLAEEYSIEGTSRALRGEVPPIRKWGGQPLLEKEAFTLRLGELSGIIQAGDKYVILLCEGLTEPVKVDFPSVRKLLEEDIHEKKLRLAMAEEFDNMQESATVNNFLAGTSRSPRKAGPGRMPPGVPILPQAPARRQSLESLR